MTSTHAPAHRTRSTTTSAVLVRVLVLGATLAQVRRFRTDQQDKLRIAVVAVDPTRRQSTASNHFPRIVRISPSE